MLRDEGYLLYMLLAARLLRQFTAGESLESFSADQKLEAAVRYQEQVMGEAAGRVSPEYRRRHREIPWDRLIGMRHRLVHGYRDVELRRIWRLVEHDVSRIIQTLETLVPPDIEEAE